MLIRFDECISWRIVEAIKALGLPRDVEIETAEHRGEQGHADIDWIHDFSHRGGRLIVSGDANMRQVHLERAALEASGLIAVFPSSKKFFDGLRKWGQAGYLITWFPAILRLAEEAAPGCHFRLPASLSGDYESVIPMRPLAEIEAARQEKLDAKRLRHERND